MGVDSRIRLIRRSDFAALPNLILEHDDGTEEEVPDYPAIAKAYAEAVVFKAVPANRLLIAACRRYLDMLDAAESGEADYYFSPEHVIDYCRFAEKFTHFESGNWEITQRRPDGTVDDSIILEPWQIWCESAIQGFRRKYVHTRLVSRAIEVVPRKNSKSLKAAIASLYDLTCGGGLAPEIPIAAVTSKQADDTLFGDLRKMLAKETDFVEKFKIQSTNDEIRCGPGRIFKLSSQGERQDGLNPSLAVFEEGHGGAASVYKVVKSAFGARPNALLRMITTAGYRPEGPGYELQQEARMVLDGRADDPTFFAAIYTLDEEDYKDPKSKAILWDKLLTDEFLIAKANPMYGIALDPFQIRTDLQSARRRPDQRAEAARTRFNIWTAHGGAIIDLAQWAACREEKLRLEDFIGSRVPCYIGVDLASRLDMCALVLLFVLPGDVIAAFAKFYLPLESETYLDPEMMDQFDAWAAADQMETYLKLTEGPLADHDAVNSDVDAFCELFNVVAIVCDPHQAHNTVKYLWDGEKPVVVYNNDARTMTPPTDDLLGRIASRKIIHDGNPVLSWNAQNTHGERRDNGSIMPRKDKKMSKRKVDGIVALCMANGARMNPDLAKPLVEDAPKRSAYESGRVIGLDDEP